jgi:hypothetical protein
MRAFAAPSIVTGSERSATTASDGFGRADVRCDCVGARKWGKRWIERLRLETLGLGG